MEMEGVLFRQCHKVIWTPPRLHAESHIVIDHQKCFNDLIVDWIRSSHFVLRNNWKLFDLHNDCYPFIRIIHLLKQYFELSPGLMLQTFFKSEHCSMGRLGMVEGYAFQVLIGRRLVMKREQARKTAWSSTSGMASGRIVLRNITYETRGSGNHMHVCLRKSSCASVGRLLS